MTKNELIGAKIKQLREQKKLLIEDMAVKLHTSVPTYSRIENGKVNITIENLYKISEILETDLYEIFNLTKGNVENSNNNQCLMSSCNHSFFVIGLEKEQVNEIKEVLINKFQTK